MKARWGVCGLLFAATLLNYLDRQTLSVTAPLIRQDLGLDLEQLGRVFSIFYWSYALGQIVVGGLIDRVNVKWAYAAAVLAWSAAGAAGGLATGLTSLLLLRALLGVFEAANWPAALRVVAETFPPRERSLANGIFQSGTSVGAIVAPPALIFVSSHWGWRAGFLVTGALGLVWVALWVVAFRPAQPARVVEETPRVPYRQLFRSPALWGLMLASAFLNPCLYFLVNWLPTYFVERGQSFGADLATMLLVIYVALDVGYLTGGALVLRLARGRSVGSARRLVVTAGTVLMTGLFWVPRIQAANAMVVILSFAALGLGWFMVNYLAFLQDVSRERVSAVAGLLGAAGSASGAILMWLVGAISKSTGSFTFAFTLMGVMPLIAWVGIRLGTRTLAR